MDGESITGIYRDAGTVITWDAHTHQVRSKFQLPSKWFIGYFWGSAQSPDGKTILLGNVGSYSASAYDTLTGQKLKTYSKGKADNNIQSLAFSPDGSRIALGYCDSHVYILSYPEGEDLLTLTLPNDPCPVSVVFSRDGRYILVPGGLGKNELWLFDAHTGKPIRQFIGQTAQTWPNATLSNDGKYLVSTTLNSVTRLWEVESGREVFQLSWKNMYMVDISPDGNLAANATSGINKIVVWSTDIEQLKVDLCKAIPRDLTAEEQKQYGITDTRPACPVEGGK
jgi:WD40 repeat protein